MDLRRTNALVFSILGTMINVILGSIFSTINILALQFNSIGTIFTAAVYGPIYGGLVGLATGVIQGFNSNNVISLVLSNMAVGIIVGFITRKKKFTYYNSLVIGLIAGIVVALILVFMNPFVYINLFSVINNNIVDKVASSLIVAFIMSRISKRFFGKDI